MPFQLYGSHAMMLSEAKKYHAYARECLKQAERAEAPDLRARLIELSRTWMEAALVEEKHHQSMVVNRTQDGHHLS